MFLAVPFALFLSFSSVLAQDPGSLSGCAVTCIQQESDCALTTPQCLCPHQKAIETCIGQSCPLSDVQNSLHAIASFCQSTSSTSSSPTTQTTSRPAATSPSPSPSSNIPTPPTSNPGTTSIKPSPSPQQPSTTNTGSSPTSNPASTTSASSRSISSTTSLPTPTPLPTLLSPPSRGSQTVVVFSTQFASPAPVTGNTSGAPASWNFVSTITPLLFVVSISLLNLI